MNVNIACINIWYFWFEGIRESPAAWVSQNEVVKCLFGWWKWEISNVLDGIKSNYVILLLLLLWTQYYVVHHYY